MQSERVEKVMQELDDIKDQCNVVVGIIVGTCLGVIVWTTLILTFGG